jgi:hypothetical protein
MTHFNDYYYYLKSIRWILNNSLANTTVESSSSASRILEKKKIVSKDKIKNPASIPDLEKWSEYKLKRLVEETMLD